MRWFMLVAVLFLGSCEYVEKFIAEQQGIDLQANPEAKVDYYSFFLEQAQKLPADKAKEKAMEFIVAKLKEQGLSDTEALVEAGKLEKKIDVFIDAAKEGDGVNAFLAFTGILVVLYGLYKGGKKAKSLKMI